MSSSHDPDLGACSMLDLFRQETEAQTAILTEGLLALERDPAQGERLAALMRAAHSLKGAARIVGLAPSVAVAHAMEDCLVAAQQGALQIGPDLADALLRGVDMLAGIARAGDADAWRAGHQAELDALLADLAARRVGGPAPAAPAPAPDPGPQPARGPDPAPAAESGQRAVRVGAEHLDRMLSMMGEVMVQTRWLEPFGEALQAMRRQLRDLARLAGPSGADWRPALAACRETMARQAESLDFFSRRHAELAERLYREGLLSRMRPFSDGVHGFPRMVRDLARDLGKEVSFEIAGQAAGVDRDILDMLEAPLAHLLRNALDHGLETPAERQAAGKPPVGRLTLEARHQAGRLLITVADDGRGIDVERVRRQAVDRGLCPADLAARLTDAEVLDFLFLPGFSTREGVTELSGRGVGLDIVRTLAQQVGGAVRIENKPGAGTRFHLQLPITLSVMRALLVEIAGQPYALPLMRIERLAAPAPEAVRTLEGRRFLDLGDRSVGLVDARAVLELGAAGARPASGAVVVLGDQASAYGLEVDRLLGESRLVVRPLDPRLGAVQDVAALALLDDGSPVAILDVDDLVRSLETLLAGGRLKGAGLAGPASARAPRKRILVVDDSITVRETERRMLEQRGYAAEAAVDGMDAWNAVHAGHYDLVVSDVDMPRLNGIELVKRIKQDPRLRAIPVVIVSYKDREEDRLRGLDAGAEQYLTKSSFHDASFLKAVADLIGDP